MAIKRHKKVLITGSLGYIGSVLLPYLKNYGYDCMGLDAGFFKDCLLYPIKEENTVLKDIREITEDDLKNVDVVIHLAGVANDPMKTLEPERVYEPGRIYTYRLASLCKELGIKFIFASSCSVYGAASSEISDEKSTPNPVTPYSLNKLQIEEDLRKLSGENFSPIILRFATVFGLSPRMRFDIVVNMFVGMALTSGKIILNSKGEAWRPFVHIKDACKAIRYSIESDFEYPLILNVGDTSQNYQIIQLANMVKEKIPGTKITFLAGKDELVEDRKITDGVDKRDYKLSFEKIKETLKGFTCEWTVKRGVRNMRDNFKKLGFTKEDFKNINFYRLQKMEYLLENNYLTDNLIWKGGMRP